MLVFTCLYSTFCRVHLNIFQGNKTWWLSCEALAEAHAGSYAEAHAEADAEAYAEAHAEAYAKARAEAYAEAHAEAYAEAHAEAYAEAHAEAYAEARAEAHADTYATMCVNSSWSTFGSIHSTIIQENTNLLIKLCCLMWLRASCGSVPHVLQCAFTPYLNRAYLIWGQPCAYARLWNGALRSHHICPILTKCFEWKGQYHHNQSRPSTGHGIGVLVLDDLSDWK